MAEEPINPPKIRFPSADQRSPTGNWDKFFAKHGEWIKQPSLLSEPLYCLPPFISMHHSGFTTSPAMTQRQSDPLQRCAMSDAVGFLAGHPMTRVVDSIPSRRCETTLTKWRRALSIQPCARTLMPAPLTTAYLGWSRRDYLGDLRKLTLPLCGIRRPPSPGHCFPVTAPSSSTLRNSS